MGVAGEAGGPGGAGPANAGPGTKRLGPGARYSVQTKLLRSPCFPICTNASQSRRGRGRARGPGDGTRRSTRSYKDGNSFIFPDTQPPRSGLSFDPHFTDEVDCSGVAGGICLLPEPLVTCPFVWPCCSQDGRELRSHAISFSDFFAAPGLSHGAKNGSGTADIMPFSTTTTRLSLGLSGSGLQQNSHSSQHISDAFFAESPPPDPGTTLTLLLGMETK